jgi:hypothetical protein
MIPAVPDDVLYGLGRIDASGRVADRAITSALGWHAGDRLTLTAAAGVVTARRDPDGMVTMPSKPYIAIPAALAASARVGMELWCGEAEAAEVVRRTVEAADARGRLRGILDAVRSNRVEDDFSEHWSYAREDFERKLYRKRSKIKVRFVELTDTIPVQGPETEVEDNLVLGDFLALLDERERQVVVLLSSGCTKVGDVASVLGYKNHSPISKRLARIRQKATEYIGEP